MKFDRLIITSPRKNRKVKTDSISFSSILAFCPTNVRSLVGGRVGTGSRPLRAGADPDRNCFAIRSDRVGTKSVIHTIHRHGLPGKSFTARAPSADAWANRPIKKGGCPYLLRQPGNRAAGKQGQTPANAYWVRHVRHNATDGTCVYGSLAGSRTQTVDIQTKLPLMVATNHAVFNAPPEKQ